MDYPMDDFIMLLVSKDEKIAIFDEAQRQHKPAFAFVREAVLNQIPQMETKDGKTKKQNS